MLNITYEVGGKSFDIGDSNSIVNAMFESVASAGVEAATAVLTEDEMKQITIKVIGDNVDDLSLNINGPEEIVEKIKSAL